MFFIYLFITSKQGDKNSYFVQNHANLSTDFLIREYLGFGFSYVV